MYGSTPTPPSLRREKLAAERLGVAGRTLRNWRVRGIGPDHIKVGRIPFYLDIDIDRWIEEKKADAANGDGA